MSRYPELLQRATTVASEEIWNFLNRCNWDWLSTPPSPELLAAAGGERAARKYKTGLDKHETKLHISQDSS